MATLQERIDTFNSILSNWIITRSDVFYSDEPKDVEVSFMDADGNEVKVTIPNIAKIKSNCADMNLSNVADSVILNKLKSVDGSGSGLDADKLDGYHLLATINPDGSFNDDGIFKIKEVNGQKTLFGILDIDMYVKSMPVTFDIFNDGSCVALYEFERNTNDTGGVYNGFWRGTTAYDIGKIGWAAKFDGSSAVSYRIDNLIPGTTYTISFWAMLDSAASYIYDNTGRGFISSYENGKNRIIKFSDNNNGKLAIRDMNGAGINTEITSTVLNKGQMYHIVVVFNDTTATCYLNANKELTVSGLASEAWSLTQIGAGQRYFVGLIDQVRIFNRALTDDEVQILYNEGA